MLRQYYNDETKIFEMPGRHVELHSEGLGCLMYERMKAYRDHVAQIDADSEEKDLYSSFLLRCTRTALKMKSMGVQYGDVVSICSHNDLNNAVPAIAAQFLGAKVASLDPTLSFNDTIYLIDLVKPKVVFASWESEGRMEVVRCRVKPYFALVVFGDTWENLRFDVCLEEAADEETFKPIPVKSVEDDAFIVFSSGTTGLPKGIRLSHKFFLYHCMHRIYNIVFGFASLYWVSAIYKTVSSILHGTTKLVTAEFDPTQVFQQIQKFNVTHLVIAPCDIIAAYDYRTEETPLKMLAVGGSFISHEWLVKLRLSFPNTIVVNGYAQTELLATLSPVGSLAMEKPGCAGQPIPGKAIKVVDPETEEALGFNQPGELRVKTEYQMSGYYNQDSSDCWDKDGYLKTGDIFYYDEDFCFFMVDRLKEMFKYKSWHIVPAKLEKILLDHPEVEQAAVVGVPHSIDDHHALAVVVLASESKVTPEELRAFVDNKVDDRHKLRAGVVFVKEMPLTPTRKIRRRDLVKMYLDKQLV